MIPKGIPKPPIWEVYPYQRHPLHGINGSVIISSTAPHNFVLSKPTENNENFDESSCKGIFVVGKVGHPLCEHTVRIWVWYLVGGIFFPC